MLRDFLLLCLVSNFMVPTISSGIKQWVPNFSFTDPRMWTQAHVPCADQLILFPAYFYALLDLPSIVRTKGIILPSFGALVFPQNGQIEFNLNPVSDCEVKLRDSVAIFKKPDRHFWYLSHNWREIDDNNGPMKINTAKPHSDRIPCTYDEVRFPPDRNFVVDLQLNPRIDLGHVQLNDKVIYPQELENFIMSREGQTMFKNGEVTRISSIMPLAKKIGLPCHTSPFEYYEAVLCYNEKEFCQIPHCLDPIQPKGFCCKICGASLLIDTQINEQSMELIVKVLKSNLMALGEAHEIDYYVGVVEINKKLQAQLVITDVEEYNEKSTKLMRALLASVLHPYETKTTNFSLSGRPYKPSEKGSFWTFVFIPLFTILAVLFLIYTYYYKVEDGKLQVLTWSIPVPGPQRLQSFFNSWNSQFIFARFENTHDDGETSIAELQIQPGTSTSTTTASPEAEIESQIQLAEDKNEEKVENLLEIDLDG